MLLSDVHWYSEGQNGYGDIRITRGRIEEIGKGLAPRFRERVLSIRDGLVLPGLVNSHDHLDFNLLPLAGNPPYSNFSEYASEVYRPKESPIKEMLSIPMRDRLVWGGYKNLISGVTTVCHHNPYHRVCGNGFPVRVATGVAWSHSLAYSKNPVEDFRNAGKRPFVIHAAEGVDEVARLEIDRLDQLGMLSANAVIVHGVGLRKDTVTKLEKARASVIWCPSSNLNLFGNTAPIPQLQGKVPITLGTDSLLTARATMFDELKVARATGFATAQELLAMVTTAAVEILKLREGTGTIKPGATADLIVLPDSIESPAETLLNSRPADLWLTLIAGRVHLADEKLGLRRTNATVDGRPKYMTGHVEKLRQRILKRLDAKGQEIVQSSLWKVFGPVNG